MPRSIGRPTRWRRSRRTLRRSKIRSVRFPSRSEQIKQARFGGMGIAQPFGTRAVTMVTTTTGMGSTVATTGSLIRTGFGCTRIIGMGSSCTEVSARGGTTTVAGVRPTTRTAIVTRTFGHERSIPFGMGRFLFARLFVKMFL